jgi:hypothetical protein
MTTTGTREELLLLLRVAASLSAYHGHERVEDTDLHQAALMLQKLETRGRDHVAERLARKSVKRARRVDVGTLIG